MPNVDFDNLKHKYTVQLGKKKKKKKKKFGLQVLELTNVLWFSESGGS